MTSRWLRTPSGARSTTSSWPICASGLRSWLDERGELPAGPCWASFRCRSEPPKQMGDLRQPGLGHDRRATDRDGRPGAALTPNQRDDEIGEGSSPRAAGLTHAGCGAISSRRPCWPRRARATSRLAGIRGINHPVNVAISNVPGSPVPLYLGGARQRAQFPISAMLDGIGLNITVFSYEDSLEFGIVVDREQLDDPWPLLDALRAGFDELRDLAKVHASHRRHRDPSEARRPEDNAMTGHMLQRQQHGRLPAQLTSIIERAERFHAEREVVSRRPSGAVTRTTLGSCAGRARRLAGALSMLGVREGDPVATLLWNQSEHLEVYFAIPAMGAVIHTLNPRLFHDELAYIVDDAQDKVIVVDESLLESLRDVLGRKRIRSCHRRHPHRQCPGRHAGLRVIVAGAEPARVAGARRTSGGGDVLHLGHHRPAQGRRLLAPGTCTAFAGCALPDQLAVSARDTILPVVPMFHANAWGLPYAAAHGRGGSSLTRAALDAVSVLDLCADERVTHGGGRAHGVDGDAGSRSRPEPSRRDLLGAGPVGRRWSRGPAVDVRGVRPPRPNRHPSVGYDRNCSRWARSAGCRKATMRAMSTSNTATASAQGVASPLFDIRARDDEGRSSRGTTRQWASSRSAAPGLPRVTTVAGAPTLHRRRLVQDRRRGAYRCTTVASGSATAQRIW